MGTVARFAACAMGIIGAMDGLFLNALVSLYHSILRLTGADPNSHGLIGFGLVGLALVGAILVLFVPRAGGVLLIAGVGFIYVIHWWALLVSPQLVVGGLIPFLVSEEGRTATAHEPGQARGPLATQ